MNHIHYVSISPVPVNPEEFLKQAKLMNKCSWDSLKNLPSAAPIAHTSLIEMTEHLIEFKCERPGCELKLKKILNLGPETVVVLDSLTGASELVLKSVSGDTILTSQPQWYHAQKVLKVFIQMLLNGTCSVVCLGHMDRVADELGNTITSVATIGKSLSNLFPKMFGEVYLSFKKDGKYFWNMDHPSVETKSRILKVGMDLQKVPQDFGTILRAQKALGDVSPLNWLIYGDIATGKSYSLGTLLKAGKQVLVLATERTESTYYMFGE